MPSTNLIADLLDAVLKAPGLRVTSVEVAQVGEATVITRRVRNLDPLKTKPATAKPGEGQSV